MLEFEVVEATVEKTTPYEGVDESTVKTDIEAKEGTSPDLVPGDKFEGNIYLGKNPPTKVPGTYTVISVRENKYNPGNYKLLVRDSKGREFSMTRSNIKTKQQLEAETNEELTKILAKQQQEAEEEQARKQEELAKEAFERGKLKGREYSIQLETLVIAGIKNIWMVGPAGCGKTTMARNLADKIGVDFYSISCGVGTSAAEFVGYKYPQREATDFAKFYAKPSVILIDEFTALDPSVAQICNAALANGYINTTTGKVYRDPECIIIATSNTFGQGANRQYVANNQLDASTIDRFVGGMMEVDYSHSYESQFEKEVVEYVWELRKVIKTNSLRRVASTRMIIEGEKLFKIGVTDWRYVLISNWTDAERAMAESVTDPGVEEKFITKKKEKSRYSYID